MVPTTSELDHAPPELYPLSQKLQLVLGHRQAVTISCRDQNLQHCIRGMCVEHSQLVLRFLQTSLKYVSAVLCFQKSLSHRPTALQQQLTAGGSGYRCSRHQRPMWTV